MNEDMKIILQASLDQSESAIKALKKDIAGLKDKLLDEKLGIGAKLDTSENSVRKIKQDIETLKEKISSKKLAINYKLNLSSENRSALNSDIDKLSNNKSVHALKLRVQLNLGGDTIGQLNKQIDALSNKLSSVKITANIDTSSVQNLGVVKGADIAYKGDDIDQEAIATSKVAESREKINNLLKESRKISGNQIRDIKEIQDSILQTRKEMILTDETGKRIGQSTEVIKNHAQATNNLYRQQKQLQKEISDWEKLKANANEEQLLDIDEIIDGKRKIMAQNDEILRDEQLYSAELQRQLEAQSKMIQMKQDQKESVRLAKLGTEVTGGKDIQYGDTKSIEEWAKSMHKSNVAVTNLKTKTKGLNDEQTQFTVTTKSSKGMVTEYTYAIDKATGKVFKMGERTREAGRRTLDFMNDIKIATARTFQWNIAMGAIYGTMNKMKEGVGFIKQLDNDLTQVAIVTGQTREQTNGLINDYRVLARETSKTISEISSVNAELVRQGLPLEEANERLNTILKLSSVADMGVNETLSVITSSVNALGESAEKTADVLVHAGNISASGVDTIGTAMTKVASSAKSAEMTIEQLTGITATLIDVTQEAPETLGNSLKSIISRFSTVNEETGELNESFNDVQEAFEAFDVDFTDAEGQIRPVYELLDEMGKQWERLDKNQKNYVATQAGGTMQGNRFIAMMENWNRVTEITNELQENATGVTDNAYEKWLDSVEAKVNNLTIAWEELWITTINTDAVKGVLEALTNVINGVTMAIETFGVEGLAVGLVVVSMATKFGVMGKTANLLRGNFDGLSNSFKKTGQSAKQFDKTVGGLIRLLSGKGINSFKLFDSAVKRSSRTTKLQSDAMARLRLVAFKLNIPMEGVKKTVMGYSMAIMGATAKTIAMNVAVTALSATLTMGLSVIITGIVTALGSFLFKSKEVTTEIQDQNKEIEKSMKAHRQNAKALRDSSKEFSELQAKVGENGETTALTADEQERYNKLVNDLAEIAPTVVDYYDEAGNAVLKYGTSLDEIIEKEEALANIEKDKAISNSDALLDEVKGQIKELEKKKAIYEKMQETGGSEGWAKWFTTWGKGSIAESVSIKNHEKDVQELNDLIINGTEEQKRVAKDALAEIERDYAKASAGIRVVNSQLEEQKVTLRQIVDIDMEDTFGSLDMSDSMKNIGTDFVTTAFSDAFDKDIDTAEDAGYKAIDDFENIFGKLQKALDDSTPKSIADNEVALRGVIKSLEDMGYPTETATQLIYEMTSAMVSSASAGDNLVVAMNLITETAKKQYGEINKLQANYQKLAKGERLSTDEMMEMMELYPELIGYMEETGDLTLKNGEVLKEVYEAKYNEMIAGLEQQKQEKQTLMANAEEERKAIKGNLDMYKLLFGEKSKMYQDELAKMEENNKAYENAEKALEKLNGQAKVYKQMFSEDFSAQNMNNLSEVYDEATNKIKFYQEVLAEIRKEGELTPETVQKIMTSHHELIGVLGDEGGMYNLLMELIAQEGEVQKNTYKEMLYNSEGFYKSMLVGHNDLFKRIADIYGLNLQEFTTMNQLMAEVASQGAGSIIAEYQKINGVTRDVAIDKLIAEQEALLLSPETDPTQHDEINKKLADLHNEKALRDAVDDKIEIKASKPINFKPISTSTGKKSSKSAKSKVELVELEIDAYLRLKKAMEDVERQQKRNEKMYEYATGSDKIKLLTKEIDLMSKQQSIANALANQYREEASKLKKELSKTIGMNDGTHGINNFNSYMKAQEDVINGLVKKINASVNDEKTYESLTKQKDEMEKQVKKFKENFEKYIEITLNTIPDLGDKWWELVYEKFERSLEIMETDLQKFEKQADRVSQKINFILQGKNDNTKNLEKEYGLIKDIAGIYQEEIKNIQDKIEANSQMVTHYENQLNKIADKQSDTYEQTSRYLILARAEQDKLAEALSSSLDNYSSQLNDQISKHVELLDKMKEKAVETFTKMRDELDKFSVKEFEVSLDTIMAELDRIDGIFMDGAEFKLDTSDARDNISGLDKNIKKMYSGISKFTEEGKKIAERTVKTEEDAVKQKEDLLALIEEQIEYENQLKEVYTEISEELAETTLEYKKIEDALQAIIDAKQEELDAVKEQFEEEEAITAMMEKRLALLKAMDDTRFSYITGQGEEVFSYDISNVNALKQELGKAQREEEKDELVKKMEEEIAEMQEKLSKTQEIHQQELAVLQSAQENVSSMLDLLEENLDTNLGDHMDKIYENLTDVYIDNLQNELETQTTLLDNLYKLIDDRFTINSSKITENVNTGGLSSSGKNATIKVGKNQSSLEDIAKAYNTDVSKLLKLNSGLKEDSVLKYGQQIKVPSFDTGGYTGEFGNEGRVGILHEKELILNKEDTNNVLQAVDIARFIASGLGGGITSPQTLEQITNNSNTEQKQVIENINVYGVKDVNDFSNQMQKVFRNGMARLS